VFQDILQEDFVDSYNNLTLKTILTVKYFVSLNKDKLLLLKTDDDSYVHIGQSSCRCYKILWRNPEKVVWFSPTWKTHFGKI
jgi:hypothetical protein